MRKENCQCSSEGIPPPKNLQYCCSFSRTSCTRRNTCWWCQRRRRSRSPPSWARCRSGWTRMATPLPPSSSERSCLSWRACAKTCSLGWRSDASGPTAWPPWVACSTPPASSWGECREESVKQQARLGFGDGSVVLCWLVVIFLSKECQTDSRGWPNLHWSWAEYVGKSDQRNNGRQLMCYGCQLSLPTHSFSFLKGGLKRHSGGGDTRTLCP